MSDIKLYLEKPERRLSHESKKTVYQIVLVGLVSSAVIIVAIFKINDLSQKLIDKRLLLKENQTQNMMISSATSDWTKVEPNLDLINNALPKADDLLNYQTDLQALASSVGVKISASFNEAGQVKSKDTNYKIVEHQVQIVGTRDQIIDFIAAVEKMPFYVNLVKFAISSNAGKETTGTLSLQLYTEAK